MGRCGDVEVPGCLGVTSSGDSSSTRLEESSCCLGSDVVVSEWVREYAEVTCIEAIVG